MKTRITLTKYRETSKPMKLWQGIIFGLAFSIAGLFILFLSIKIIASYNEKSKTYIEVIGHVTNYETNDEGLKAIIATYIVDNESYQIQSNSYTNIPKSLGTEVSIKYNPSKHSEAIWTHESTNFILPIMGLIFTIFGVVIMITTIKKNKILDSSEKLIEQDNGLYSNIEIDNKKNEVK